MKRSLFVSCVMLLASLWLVAQDKPVVKVDFNEASRSNMEEVLEPTYSAWPVGKATTSSSKTFENVTFTLNSADGIRASWSKALVQSKTDNSRFTQDGVVMESDKNPGEFTLTLKGLPAGTHTLQTFHNDWSDPAKYCGLPIHIFLNGEEKALVHRSWQKTAVGDAASALIVFSVSSESDEAVFRFYTNIDDDFDNDNGQTSLSGCPVLNGFELNTTNASAKSKKPYPADGDLHADADSGSLILSWSPAGASVKKHYLYFGTDQRNVSAATTATAGVFKAALETADTTFVISDLYSMDTYYWRVDEEDVEGTVTPGDVWSFRPRHLAFPGAEGYGRFALGGRGGVVYHVTNL